MTSKQLESLNRKTRILARLKAGDRKGDIASDERVCSQYVHKLSKVAAIERKPVHRWEFVRNLGKHRLIPLEGESVWQMTPSEASWKRISDALDAYNRRVGRI